MSENELCECIVLYFALDSYLSDFKEFFVCFLQHKLYHLSITYSSLYSRFCTAAPIVIGIKIKTYGHRRDISEMELSVSLHLLSRKINRLRE